MIFNQGIEHLNPGAYFSRNREPWNFMLILLTAWIFDWQNGCLFFVFLESLHSIKPAQKRSKDKAAKGAIIAIFVICLLIVVIVIVVRKLYYRKREKIEKANFDFRDSDDISLSSLQLFEKPSCFPWCGNRTSCGAECVPLCDHAAGRKLYTL